MGAEKILENCSGALAACYTDREHNRFAMIYSSFKFIEVVSRPIHLLIHGVIQFNNEHAQIQQ